MRRLPAPRLSRTVAVLAAGLLLGACGGSTDASRGDVQDDVEEELADVGFVAGPGAAAVELTAGQAASAAACVADALFDGETFSKDERNDVTGSGDGTPPDPDLASRFQDLVAGCVETATAVGPSAPDDEG